MEWRLAKSLEKLRNQLNKDHPKRSKKSDGTIGDAAHQAQGKDSDHNPWIKDGSKGVVTAFDITHDPKNGVDIAKLSASLTKSRDKRIKYMIRNQQILVAPNWKWQSYIGDPHTDHLHLSVKSAKTYYDNTKDWSIKMRRTVNQLLRDALRKSRAKTAYYKKWSEFWKKQAKRLRDVVNKLKGGSNGN